MKNTVLHSSCFSQFICAECRTSSNFSNYNKAENCIPAGACPAHTSLARWQDIKSFQIWTLSTHLKKAGMQYLKYWFHMQQRPGNQLPSRIILSLIQGCLIIKKIRKKKFPGCSYLTQTVCPSLKAYYKNERNNTVSIQ